MSPWAWCAGAGVLLLGTWWGFRAIEGRAGGAESAAHDLVGDGRLTLFALAARWRTDPHLRATQERLRERMAAAPRPSAPPLDTYPTSGQILSDYPTPRPRLEILAALSDLRAEAQGAGEEDLAMEIHKLLLFRAGSAVVVRRHGDIERTN